MRIALPDLAATERLGIAIAEVLRPGDAVALSGGLGAGKTTLARAIIAALGHTGEVPSPSFAIIELYAPPELRLPVVHADFYRLASPREVEELGLDEYRDGAALIAEWPEHAGGFAHEPGCLAVTLALTPWFDGRHQPAPPPGLPKHTISLGGRVGERAGADHTNAENADSGRIAIVKGGADWLGRMPCPPPRP